ncbi:MAG: carboxypeptidase-like regulatory domain-containing protein [Bacteroidales bacterium]|jgi:hypothetical protein|nr:carboxypeptidase-like regulatory domain-containing protein [Bacteroidales bacterium]
MKQIVFIITSVLSISVFAQTDYTEYKGKIINKETKKPVSYAHLQHKTLKIITQANNEGIFVFKIPNKFVDDSLIISCVSYTTKIIAIKDVAKRKDIELIPVSVQLQSLTVHALPTGEYILEQVKKHIKDNYYIDTTISTFFFRRYGIVDSNMIVFNEAIFDILRCGAGRKTGSFSYVLNKKSNFKKPLLYRLLIYDTLAVDTLSITSFHKNDIITFQEDTFFDIIEFPKLAYIFKKIKEFSFNVSVFNDADSNKFYKIIACPKKNTNKYENIEIIVNTQNYVLTYIKYKLKSQTIQKTNSLQWAETLNEIYNIVIYSKIGNKYIMSKDDFYYDYTCYDSIAKPHNLKFSHVYSLIDLSKDTNSIRSFAADSTVLSRVPQKYDEIFTDSNYDESFWQQYNFVPLDTEIRENLNKAIKQKMGTKAKF